MSAATDVDGDIRVALYKIVLATSRGLRNSAAEKVVHDLVIENARLTARAAELEAALNRLVNTKALKSVRKTVAGWNGENLPNYKRYERHPSRMGATINTNCGAMYDLDEAMIAARILAPQEPDHE